MRRRRLRVRLSGRDRLSKSVAAEISGSGALAYSALGITGQDGMIADVSRTTSRAAHARSPSG
jgi:hypothetical protein